MDNNRKENFRILFYSPTKNCVVAVRKYFKRFIEMFNYVDSIKKKNNIEKVEIHYLTSKKGARRYE